MKKTIGSGLAPLHLAIALALAGTTSVAAAQESSGAVASHQRFSIPAGPLNEILLGIARQSGRAISFDPAVVAGQQGATVSGDMTVEKAIATSLQGTDLALDVTSNGTLTVSQQPQPLLAASGTSASEDAQLPEIAVNSSAINEDALYYNPGTSSTVTRGEATLKETPQSVEVISSKLITDRQAVDLQDVLKNSSGVNQSTSNRGQPSYSIRGFSVAQTSTNGISDAGIRGMPIQGIERVEVIKGPDSIMAGSSSPGGTINLVRKAPVTEDIRTLTLEAAEDGEFREAIDLGGALNESDALSYRLNISNMKSDKSEPDFDGKREVYVAPALTWKGDTTKLTIGAEYSDARSAAPRSTIALDGKIIDLPSARLFRTNDGFKSDAKTGYYELSQDLVGGWSFNSKATYYGGTDNIHIWQLNVLNRDGSVLFASPFAGHLVKKSWGTQNDIRGTVETGFVKHKILVGIDYQHVRATQDDRYVEGEMGAFPDVNVYDPDSIDNLPIFGGPNYRSNDQRLQQRGLILQNQMDIGDRVHVLLAAKKAKWITDSTAYEVDGSVFNSSHIEAEKWVPNYGISFDVTPQATIYANLLHGFEGSSDIDPNTGEALSPQTSKSKEVGVKLNLLDDSLTLTAAYFELEQNNVPVTDPFTSEILGVQSNQSRGYDLNLSGEILPGWEVSTSYTRIKYSSPGAAEGTNSLFVGEPKQSFKLWTSYQLQSGLLKGAGAGIGIDAFSDTKGGTDTDTYNIPGGALTDVSLFYRADNYSVTLGVKNVFDRTLYYSSTSTTFVPLRDERTARLTLVYNF